MTKDLDELSKREPLSLEPIDEYLALVELLKKYKTDLIHWRLKTQLVEARQSNTQFDEPAVAQVIGKTLEKSRSEEFICEETITNIRNRMAEVYGKLSKEEKESIK